MLAWPAPGGAPPFIPLSLAVAGGLLREGCERASVVVRGDVAERLCSWLAPGTRVVLVESAMPDDLGPAGSLAAWARQAGVEDDAVYVVTPVDVDPAACRFVPRLTTALQGLVDAAKPSHGGRGGHPVAVRGRLLAGYRQASPPLRDVLAGLDASRLRRVAVDDPCIHTDLDEPGQLAALGLGRPRFL